MSLVDVRVLDFACPLISSFSKCFSSLVGDASSHAQQLEFIGYHFDEPDDQAAYLKDHFVECLEKDFLFKPIKESYNIAHLNKSFSNLANLRRRTVTAASKPPGHIGASLAKNPNYLSKIDPVLTDKQFLSPSGIEFSGLGFFGNDLNRDSDQQRESVVVNKKPESDSLNPKRDTVKIFDQQPHSGNRTTDRLPSNQPPATQPSPLQASNPPEEFTLKGTEKSDKGNIEKLALPKEAANNELKDSGHMFSEFPECILCLTVDHSEDEND